ncbi:MAG: cation transporter [Proteobacteria bacterium]|nr:cation transporter [Pseudomonadota bacterium]
MAETDIKIEGMSCQHCVMAVKKAIGGLKGIENADVAIGSAAIKYDESKVKKEEIEAAIEKTGFKVSRGFK